MMIAEINQPSYRLISICVTVVHVLLMGMIFLFSSYSPVIDRPAPKKLVVKTITLNQKKEVITTYSPPLNKKKESKQETKPVYIKKTEVVEIPTPSMKKKLLNKQ